MADLLDSSTNVIMGLLVSIILICSALVPVALSQIESLENFANALNLSEQDVSMYTNMIEIVLVLAIVGLIIGVVRTYTRTNEVD